MLLQIYAHNSVLVFTTLERVFNQMACADSLKLGGTIELAPLLAAAGASVDAETAARQLIAAQGSSTNGAFQILSSTGLLQRLS
jgi:hypothetical protein